jgi:hypothetical protein
LSEFQALGSLQDEIAKQFCRFQLEIREEGTRLHAATQNAIGNTLSRLLDTSHGDDQAVSRLTIKKVFAVCRDKYCSINGAPIGCLVDKNMYKERAMLAQADTTQVLLADSNGKSGKSDSSDAHAKIKKELTFAQKEIAKLKNQLHQAKDNIAKE